MSDNIFTKYHGKTVRNGYKSNYGILRSIIRNISGKLHIFLKFSYPAGRSTKHLVDRLSASYIGFNR